MGGRTDPGVCRKCGVRAVAGGGSVSAKAARKKELCHTCYNPKKEGVGGRGERNAGSARAAKELAAAEAVVQGSGEESDRFEERFLATMMWIFVGERPERIVARLRGAADYVERAFVKKGRGRR